MPWDTVGNPGVGVLCIGLPLAHAVGSLLGYRLLRPLETLVTRGLPLSWETFRLKGQHRWSPFMAKGGIVRSAAHHDDDDYLHVGL